MAHNPLQAHVISSQSFDSLVFWASMLKGKVAHAFISISGALASDISRELVANSVYLITQAVF